MTAILQFHLIRFFYLLYLTKRIRSHIKIFVEANQCPDMFFGENRAARAFSFALGSAKVRRTYETSARATCLSWCLTIRYTLTLLQSNAGEHVSPLLLLRHGYIG